MPWPMPSNEALKNVKIVAHRGWHDDETFKENTLQSFVKAYEEGLWGVEFDIRWTKDHIPVVHHDLSCKRVWGQDFKVQDKTFKELRLLIPQIPSLEEVVGILGGKIHFFIELKEEKFPKLLEQKATLDGILTSLKPTIDFHIISLSTGPIQKFNLYDLKTYLLVGDLNFLAMSELALVNGYGGITGHYLLATQEVLNNHHSLDQKIGTGFIRTMACLKREVNRDVEWLFTNHPWNLRKVLSAIESGDSKN